jgi:hypothetical protein
MSGLHLSPQLPSRLKVPVPPQGRLIPRTFSSLALCVSLAIVGLGVLGLGAPVDASPSANQGAGIRTPLPVGWESCVLQGVGAPVTQDDIADLDEWQVAEGGSTNNAAAYNPFNTRQMTDSTGTALPAIASSSGFPAFTNWAAGCSATVATLLKPNMAPIVTALIAGDISPPGLFLSDVDETSWCAPSVAGIPCYANEILAGELIGSLLSGGSGQLTDAVTKYSDTSTDLSAYEQAVSGTAADQSLLTERSGDLVVAENAESKARGNLSSAALALRRLALDDYTTDRMLSADASFQLSGSPDEQGMLSAYFRGIAVRLMIDGYERAVAAVKTTTAQQLEASASVADATSVLDSAESLENQNLARLEEDVESIEAARACAGPPVSTPTASSVDGSGSPSQLWSQLQGCLTAASSPGTPTT